MSSLKFRFLSGLNSVKKFAISLCVCVHVCVELS